MSSEGMPYTESSNTAQTGSTTTTALKYVPVKHHSQTTIQDIPHFINRLPNELLAEVFTVRVHHTDQPVSPVKLLLVCREWFNIAISTPALWTNIIFCNISLAEWSDVTRRATSLEKFSRNAVLCSTVEMLSRIIERAGALKFTLGLIYSSYTTLDMGTFDFSAIKSRCEAVHFWWWSDTPKNREFMEGLRNMLALEEIHFHPPVTLSLKTLTDILLDVQANSAHLSELTLLLTIIPPTSQDPLKPFSHLLNRLKSFTYTTRLAAGPNAMYQKMKFDRLEELNVDMDLVMMPNPPEIPQLKTLTLRNGRMGLNTLQPYTFVTSLSIHFPLANSYNPVTEQIDFQLLQLKNLSIDGSWRYLQVIHAPELETLTLRGISTPSSASREEHLRIGSTKNRPRILHIDKAFSEKLLVELLRHEWKEIEELHLTMMERNETIGTTLLNGFLGETLLSQLLKETLVSQFLGTTYDNPACPNLKRLILTYPVMEEKGLGARIQEEETIKRLGSIIDARRPGGKLQHVSFGWYPATTSTVQHDKNHSWNVKWSRLL